MRVFKFLNVLGSEIHTINDPEHRLPIPHTRQVITIGFSQMLVQAVLFERTDSSAALVYSVLVRETPASVA